MDLESLDIVGGATSGFPSLYMILIALAVCILAGVLYKSYFSNDSKCDGDDLCFTENEAPEDVAECDGDRCPI